MRLRQKRNKDIYRSGLESAFATNTKGMGFVFEPEIANYISDDQTYLERGPLEQLALEGQLMAFKHSSFWQPMDTLRDKKHLENLWTSNNAPWKKW